MKDWRPSYFEYRNVENPILLLETTAEDRLATKRLEGLLDYVEALVKLDERPATHLAQHKLADGGSIRPSSARARRSARNIA